jgi:hypothetical protein
MKIESRFIGKGRHLVTLRREDKTPALVDEVVVATVAGREKFMKVVQERFPAYDCAPLEQHLITLADRKLDDDAEKDDDEEEPLDAPEDVAAAIEALTDPDLMDTIGADLQARGLATDLGIGLLVYVAFTSRLLEEPLSVFAQGPSSSGKTFIGKVVSGLVPPECVFDVQGITPQALFYMDDRLKHAVILMGEWARDEDQTDDGVRTAALRQLISDGRLSKLVTNTESGRPTTEQATTEGPVAVYATSTLPMDRIFEEDENRFQFAHTDETSRATREVMKRKARDAAGEGDDPEVIERIGRRQHAMQRDIAKHAASVVVPFATHFATLFPDDQPRRRRDITKVMGFVKACALLHHRQRRRDAAGRIVATVDDYRIIHGLLGKFMRKNSELTPTLIRKHTQLMVAGIDPGRTFKRTDAEAAWELKKTAASVTLKSLRNVGLIDWDESAHSYLMKDQHAEEVTFLPDPEAVARTPARTPALVSEAAKLFNAKIVSEVSR